MLEPREQVEKFGFEWPAGNALRPSDRRATIQVTRTSSILRSNGEYRVVRVATARDRIHVYVSPTGQIRVFRDDVELTS